MTALAREGWRTLSLADFQTTPHSPRSFLLTFDDGYASLAEHAYPILQHLDFTATTFLITDFMGRTNTWDARYTWRRLPHLSWDAVERWRKRGFAFGSHGATHRRLTWLSSTEVAQELGRSRAELVRRLGPDAGQAVAYPFGATDAGVRRAAAAAGYDLGFSSVRGAGSPLDLPRLPVYLWDVGSPPFGMRTGALGTAARLVAGAVTRCAIGTSIFVLLRR